MGNENTSKETLTDEEEAFRKKVRAGLDEIRHESTQGREEIVKEATQFQDSELQRLQKENSIASEFKETGERINSENATHDDKKKKVPWWKFDKIKSKKQTAAIAAGTVAAGGAIAGGMVAAGSAVKEKTKSAAINTTNYLKESFSNKGNLLITLGFLNLVFDSIFRLYNGAASVNNPYTVLFDTIILVIVLFAYIKVGWKAGFMGIIIWLGAINIVIDPISKFLTNTAVIPDYIAGTIVRTLFLFIPVLIFSFTPIVKDEDLNQKKGLIIAVLIAYVWETGIQAFVFKWLTDNGAFVLFRDPVGFAAATIFYFFCLNGWMLLGIFGKFSEICKPTKLAKLFTTVYFTGLIILIVVASIFNWGFWNTMTKTQDNVNANQAISTSVATLGQSLSDKVYMWQLDTTCGQLGSIYAFNLWPPKNPDGTDMTPDQACKEKDRINKLATFDQRTNSQLDMSTVFNALVLPNSMYDNYEITSTQSILTSGKIQIQDNTDDQTNTETGKAGCYINSENNPGNAGEDDTSVNLVKDVPIYEGTTAYTCRLPANTEKDWNKLYDYFGSSKQFNVVSYFNYTIMLSAPLQLSFGLQQIDLSNYGLKKQTTTEQPAAGTSTKKSAIFKIGTEVNVPIIIKKDVTPIIINMRLDNAADGKIKTLNHLYVLLPDSILIDPQNSDIKEITTTIDPKVLREIKKRCRYEEMNYKIYELDTQSDSYKTLNKQVAENNKLATNIFLDVYKNILFKDKNYPEDLYIWVVSDYNYVVTKTQSLTLSDEIYNDIQSKRTVAPADATSVPITVDDSGFAEVAAKELSPEIKATLDIIAWAEGTSGANGYHLIFGGSTFSSYASHPRYSVPGPAGPSDAAGRYQFLSSTWDDVAKRIKATDFSPATQDRGAVEKLKMQGAYDSAVSGDILAVCSKINKIWVSLPGGDYQTRNAPEILSMYKKRLDYYKTQNSGVIT